MNTKNKINQIIRVDLAGEKGAIEIYKGQLAIIKDESLSKEIKIMLKKEEEHLKKFSELIVKYKVRPTILDPVWRVGAFSLGVISATLGKKATMACTEAVEEVIIEHYESQTKYLKGKDENLRKVTEKFAADEKNHMQIAKDYDTGNDPFHRTFKLSVKALSKIAIKISQKI
jgi:ubiquinone biosynthesis monooxygenase Coq7